jgi:hypothetical protein
MPPQVSKPRDPHRKGCCVSREPPGRTGLRVRENERESTALRESPRDLERLPAAERESTGIRETPRRGERVRPNQRDFVPSPGPSRPCNQDQPRQDEYTPNDSRDTPPARRSSRRSGARGAGHVARPCQRRPATHGGAPALRLSILIMPPPPNPRLIAPQRRAIEPLVHPPKPVQTARIG